MNKLLTPYKDGIYKALFYGHYLELDNGDKLKTDIGVRCPRNACGSWKTYKIEDNTFEEIENFAEKLSDVKPKTKLPDGTFTNKAATIKKILVEHSKNKNDCIKKINFYINRAGKNLENRTEVMKAKKMIENMIDFSDLTERLNRINFSNKFPLIKFTFDVNKVINRVSNKKQFSNSHMCNSLDYSKMIDQKEVYNKINDKYKKFKGFCTLVSIYNAFQDIFYNVDELINFIENQLNNKRKISSLKEMTNAVNRYKNKNLLFNETNLKESYTIFTNNILNNKPVVISYGYNDRFYLQNQYSQHTVVLLGYDDDLIYYKENSENNYLFTSLMYYIIEYYRFNKLLVNNNILKELINENDELKRIELSKQLLGYIENKSKGICAIKKDFLTNKQYFYDLNRLITYNITNFDNNNSDNFYKFSL